MTAKSAVARQLAYISRKRKALYCGWSGCNSKSEGFYCSSHKKAHAVYQASLRAIKRESKALPTNEVSFGEAK